MGDSTAAVPVSRGEVPTLDVAAASPALIALHGQFLQHLTLLDQAGEHIAAAHLVSAIDALEARLGVRDGGANARREEARLELFVDGLLTKLGDRALDVARWQLSEASGNAVLAWTAIADRIAAKRS